MIHAKRLLIVLPVLMLFKVNGLAQEQKEKLVEIDEVLIVATRSDLFGTAGKQTTDSMLIKIYQYGNVGQLLELSGPAEIKTYGSSGSLSGIVMRGAGSSNTEVSLNGFPVNSVSTGGMDLSLLPAAFFSEVSVIAGAESSLFGSGTFGGVLELNTFEKNPDYDYKIGISSEIGSYGNQKYLGKIGFNRSKFQYHSSAVIQKAENDFPFINPYKVGSPEETRMHNAYSYYGWLQTAEIQFSQRDRLKLSSILFSKDLQLPEVASSATDSRKLQQDSGAYFTIRYHKALSNGKLSVGSALMLNALHYTEFGQNPSDIPLTDSKISSLRLSNEISYRKIFNNHIRSESGLTSHFLHAQSANYRGIVDEFDGRVFTAFSFRRKNSMAKLSASAEFSEHYDAVPLFSAGIFQQLLNNKMSLFFRISNKFRRPGFNERFWQPGGNPEVRPEKAIQTESGIKIYLIDKPRQKAEWDTRIYYTKINNMIRWIPEGGVWTAQNSRRVHNRGLESDLIYQFKILNIRNLYKLSYYYTRSDTAGLFSQNRNEQQQLMYVPMHRIKLLWQMQYKNFDGGIAARYIGIRYTTDFPTLNNQLPAYFKADVFASYHFNIYGLPAEISARAENITNSCYESIKSYPMPGRMYFIGLSLQTQKSNKK